MTDRTDKKTGEDELDWDAALDAWERTAFDPSPAQTAQTPLPHEKAHDKETQRPAVLESDLPPLPAPPEALRAPRPAAFAKDIPAFSDYGAEREATRIAEVPKYLFRGAEPPPPPSADKPAGAGLKQLFGRGPEPTPAAPSAQSRPPAMASDDDLDALLDSHESQPPSHDAPSSLPVPLLPRYSDDPPPASPSPAIRRLTGDQDKIPTAPPLAPTAVPPPPTYEGRREAPKLHVPRTRRYDPDSETATFEHHLHLRPLSRPPREELPTISTEPEGDSDDAVVEVGEAVLDIDAAEIEDQELEGDAADAPTGIVRSIHEEPTAVPPGVGPGPALTYHSDEDDDDEPDPTAAWSHDELHDLAASSATKATPAPRFAAPAASGVTDVPRISSSAVPADLASRSSVAPERSASFLPPPPVEPLAEGAGDIVAALAERAAWLEEEVRGAEDHVARARGLLAVSELRAILGERNAAAELAREARDTSPEILLAHRQVRGLVDPTDRGALLETVDASLRATTAPSARLHDVLLAVDVHRREGDGEAAAKRWSEAASIAPGDARVVAGRAAFALAKGDAEDAAKSVPEGDRGAIARAVANAVRLRGGAVRARADGGPPAPIDTPIPGEVPAPSDAPIPNEVPAPSDALIPNEALLRARAALRAGDVKTAAAALGELRQVPDVARAAAWMSASLGGLAKEGRAASAAVLQALDDRPARRALAARALEMGDAITLESALTAREPGAPASFSAQEELVLRLLLDPRAASASGDDDPQLASRWASAAARLVAVVAAEDGAAPLAAAAANVGGEGGYDAGRPAVRRASHLGRLFGRLAPMAAIDAALAESAADAPVEGRIRGLDAASRAGRWGDVSDALGAWEAAAARPEDRSLAAALVAERAIDTSRAAAAYRAARDAEPAHEGALRGLAATDPDIDLPRELLRHASAAGPGLAAAMSRLEAVTRATDLDDGAREDLLEAAHQAAPELPIPVFLAERIARRRGAMDRVLHWVRARREQSNDPLERALDAVREALLVAGADEALATERLVEAHLARPDDVALRDLYERISAEPPADRGAWRERRANASTGETRTLLLLDAAHEYERIGDHDGAVRAATAAAMSSSAGLERIVLERTELLAGQVGRLADELLERARSTDSAVVRREAYERLAEIDAAGRGDAASALLWHRTILEEHPSHKPSLRHVEHALLGEGRDDELEPTAAAIAFALAGTAGGECVSHAAMAARLRLRSGDWQGTKDLAELARSQADPPLWTLRLFNAHARASGDHAAELASTLAIMGRVSKPSELASLATRAGEAALRAGDPAGAAAHFARATQEDPADSITWWKLAGVHKELGDTRAAAEALESVARTSALPTHQLQAWYDAAIVWGETLLDERRAVAALEQAAVIDVAYADVFARLSAAYVHRGARTELAELLEKRVATVTEPGERVTLEIERGRVLADVGDTAGARAALDAALASAPDDTQALAAFADVCARTQDWEAAEQAWVRLARLLAEPDEQRAIYMRLGDLYSSRAVNLARAEVSWNEVLKRAPDDTTALERLVDVYRRQDDGARAIETQQQLISRAGDATERRTRLIELSAIYETTLREVRKAEQALETARRELPADVVILRALAEFYTRHRQMPAVQILLDRAAADARRAFAAGRFAPALFEVMAAVYELRGRKDAAQAVSASLAAFTAAPVQFQGVEGRACDPRLDEFVAPEALTPALRALLARTGDALDVVTPLDLRAIRAGALPPSGAAVGQLASSIAAGLGMGGLQVYASPTIGQTCLPVMSSPPTIVVGEPLLSASSDVARTFLIIRALKLVQARASALLRTSAKDLPVLVAAWLQAFNPNWQPQGVNATALADVLRRFQQAIPRRVDPDVALLSLEVAGSLGAHAPNLGVAAVAWADRVALLAVGNPQAALDAVAFSLGVSTGAPSGPQERAAWIGRTQEAKEIIAFSVSEAYAEARARCLGIASPAGRSSLPPPR